MMLRVFGTPAARPRAPPARGATRGFARKRARLDEYNTHDAPLRRSVWRKAKVDGEGFYPYKFEDMTPPEVTETVHLASKLHVASPEFWRRAAFAVGDVASALAPKQLATCCHAFGAARWRDEALVSVLAPAIAKCAGEMRPGDLAVTIQSLARSSTRHNTALQALSRAVQANQRIASKGFTMIAESFASMRYQNEGFIQRLDDWADAGGTASCSAEEAVVLAHSLSMFELQSTGPGHIVIAGLCDRFQGVAGVLQPPALHTALLSVARLRCSDATLVQTFERIMSEDLHRLHVKNLPAVLDAFTQLYQSCGENDQMDIEGPEGTQRRRFLARLTSRIARQLRHLRPQDASRAMQGLDRLGFLDPVLLQEASEIVPRQLAMRPAIDTLTLLESYAAAGNADGFMLPCLRRALLPIAPEVAPAAVGGEALAPISKVPISQLDDIEAVRLVAAFIALQHREGLLAAIIALDASDIQIAPSCLLAVAAHVAEALPDERAWMEAAEALRRAESSLPEAWPRAGELSSLAERWRDRAEPMNAEADDVLLAVCAFQEHPAQPSWERHLISHTPACAASLLPGLLLKASLPELRDSSEAALLDLLEGGAIGDMPVSALVAAARALAQPVRGQSGERTIRLRRAVFSLAYRVGDIAEAESEQVSAKALVRTLQALRAAHLDAPTGLLRALARSAAEGLTATELLVALRLLPGATALRDAGCTELLGAAATRAMGQFKSSRQAWALDSLCRNLELELGEVEAVVGAASDDEAEPHGKSMPA
mmetsp:Transcript_82735/g.232970  ORF Transcript_82735/g.232970 Transcript_82735/m.232970 type:complete len:772 (-) Transcript_82735:10-2325(-)